VRQPSCSRAAQSPDSIILANGEACEKGLASGMKLDTSCAHDDALMMRRARHLLATAHH
jgi:hypothetical protein